MVANFNMPGKLNRIGNNYVISQKTIVSNVRICHQQTITSYHCFPFIFCTSVYGNTFSYCGIISHFNKSFFTIKFEVLWNSANYGAWKNFAAFTNNYFFHDHNMRHNMRTITNDYIIFNYCKRINNNILP